MPAESNGLHRAETFSALDQRRRVARRACSKPVLPGTPGAKVTASGLPLARVKAFNDALDPAPGDIP